MEIETLNGLFAVAKLPSVEKIDLSREFTFLSVTDGEISLLCRENDLPDNCLTVEKGWRGFRVCGTLDFSLVGILSAISTALAEKKIGLFAVSTYDTDYIFVKKEDFGAALETMEENGFALKTPKKRFCGMPNPMREYPDAASVNAAAGTDLRLPDGAENVKCFVISSLAELRFTLGGHGFSFRGKKDDGSDISGIYVGGKTLFEGKKVGKTPVYACGEGYISCSYVLGGCRYCLTEKGEDDGSLRKITSEIIQKTEEKQ